MLKLISKFKNMPFEQRAWLIVLITSVVNFALAVGKFVFGIAVGSYYLCVIAAYGALVGLIKQRCYNGKKKELEPADEVRRYIEGGLLMLGAGIVYIVYSARLLYYPENAGYGLIPAIAIAAFGFLSLGLSITGMVKAKGKGLLFREIKILSFTSALTDIVLVQIALLAASGSGDNSVYNAYIGIGVGAVICLFSLVIIGTGVYNYRKGKTMPPVAAEIEIIEHNRGADE